MLTERPRGPPATSFAEATLSRTRPQSREACTPGRSSYGSLPRPVRAGYNLARCGRILLGEHKKMLPRSVRRARLALSSHPYQGRGRHRCSFFLLSAAPHHSLTLLYHRTLWEAPAARTAPSA